MMYSLSAQEILYIWDVAQHQHPVDQALTILSVALPELSPDELHTLSVGQRDAYLFALREQTFGRQLASFAECPACQEGLEFTLDVADICVAPDSERCASVQQVMVDGYELHFHLPNSLDLATIAHCRDVVAARDLLVQRCLVQAIQDGEAVAAERLPEEVIVALADQMAKCDPQAEVQLNLVCSLCGQQWSVLFDIVSFFWTELCALAKRLLREVHMLARAYGWREADILSLSAARRQFYLEMV